MGIRYQGAVIFVEDIAASRRFYEELLGQEVDIDFGPNVGFKGGFALWRVDHAFGIIYGHTPDKDTRLGRRNFELHFETPDLDALSKQISEAGVEFVHPLYEQPWGQCCFRVHDPDGHVVEMGEPMDAVVVRLLGEGISSEAVSRRTGMPQEMVDQIAKG